MQGKLCTLILILASLLGLGACDVAVPMAVSPTPLPISSGSLPAPSLPPSTPPDASAEALAPASSPSPQLDNTLRGELFRSFLADNYKTITETCFCTITGIGFLDLDRDSGIEMIVFDPGASASMGLQFFDIVDGAVECVSANMLALGETFKGKHFSKLFANANYFDDFRLRQKPDGSTFFTLESSNGALDFRYVEQLRFGSDNGILTLHSDTYKHSDFDDKGNVILEKYRVDNKDASLQDYDAAILAQKSAAADTGFTAQGVFVYDKPEYENGLEGVLAMTDKALELSKTSR